MEGEERKGQGKGWVYTPPCLDFFFFFFFLDLERI
jgi:hypothetical protein